MFDASKRAVLGVAVLSGVTVSVGAGGASAQTVPAPEGMAVSTASHCAVLAVSPAGLKRGDKPVIYCGTTTADAVAGLDRAVQRQVRTGSLVASAGYAWLATHYRHANTAVRNQYDELIVNGGDCSWSLPDTLYLANDLSATRLGSCSSTKQFKGYNFTGESFHENRSSLFSLDPYWDNQIRSVRYGA